MYILLVGGRDRERALAMISCDSTSITPLTNQPLNFNKSPFHNISHRIRRFVFTMMDFMLQILPHFWSRKLPLHGENTSQYGGAKQYDVTCRLAVKFDGNYNITPETRNAIEI